MMEEYMEKAYELSQVHRRISPAMLVRKFEINHAMASKICNKVSLRRHLEARKLAREIEPNL